MKKLAIPALILALLVVVGGWLWQSGWLGGGSKGYTAYVPADTVLYFGGTTNPEVSKRMSDYPIGALDPAQLAELFDRMEQRAGDDAPGMELLRAFLLDFSAHSATYGELFAHYGFDLDAEQAIYMHGLYPVMRMPIADTAAFEAFWAGLSEESGVSPVEEVREGVNLQRWPLGRIGGQGSIELVVAMQESLATITLFSSTDSELSQLERIGLRQPESSLADSGELPALIEAQGFSNDFAGFIHIQRLAEGLLGAKANGLSRDIDALASSLGETSPIGRDLSPVCRNEFAGLASGVPRMLFGYQSVGVEGDTVGIKARSLLEISSAEVVGPLMDLRGHLPGQIDGEQMLGLALATNMDTLVPTLTKLWREAGKLSFSCPQLQQAQRQMMATSPAPLGVVTGMAQGIKGVALSLYDIRFSEASGLPESVDLLLSLATENPELLLSLFNTTVVPQSGGRVAELPLNGDLTEVDLGFLSPGLKATLGLEGQHLVVYSGEQGARAAKALAGEPLDSNGLMAVSIDYSRIGQWFSTLPNALLSQVAGATDEFCLMQARVRKAMISQPMRMRYRADMESGGLSAQTDLEMLPVNHAVPEADELIGRYELRDLNQNCGQPPMIGHEEINADGTGFYTEYDATGQCETLRYNYRWTKVGDQLRFDVQGGEYRDACNQEWGAMDAHAAQCEILASDGGFDCIYTDDEGEGLYRYRRVN
ncbi:hypothetical protein GCM10011352_28920 [Marinobacterium zhoushanense]|uniref:Uncharacterized protein n=1 Tax=Marinobacterium zhoushanense TaxID=1679163 RepID=A0ABQ1KM38_9GAMM|nr:hypothetical protein [Marinobacterium zhoushanense]GGC00985.1 hypothetical protein GCM10011352_28920 [Marinobacterium zhoushanense]